ncbi:Uncharacterised protein [Klebsiella pneumoniae subsp. ozaenae]|uniref:Uncharacterized protein n=1 Tax=Klebsiella pneumoniae subsp. ozaenae TaxID=574 RepID=A0A378B1W9_KLEPO|nr:Uncharacterised protein [Klebsiella pneumoniae subsp. ozaenae]
MVFTSHPSTGIAAEKLAHFVRVGLGFRQKTDCPAAPLYRSLPDTLSSSSTLLATGLLWPSIVRGCDDFGNRRRRKLFTVLQRAEREVLAKMVAQGAGAGKPAALQRSDRCPSCSPSGAGGRAAVVPPAASGRAFYRWPPQSGAKRCASHAGALGEGSDGMAGGKMLVQIVKQLTEAQALPAAGYRAQDLLRLAAVAMGRDDQAAATTLAASLPKSSRTQMQTKVDPRRAAGGSHQQSIAPRKGRPPPPGSAENGTAAPRCSASGLSPGGH